MSILTDLRDTIKHIGLALRDLDSRLKQVEQRSMMIMAATYRTTLSNAGQYTVVEYKRSDGTLSIRSTLSSAATDGSGTYTVRTEDYYKKDGTTLARRVIYALTYDNFGGMVQETITSDVSY